MKNNTLLMKVINEMMYYAALEIGFEHSDENVEQVIMDLEYNYGIKFDANAPVTYELMRVVCNAIEDWKVNTKNNFPELCAGE